MGDWIVTRFGCITGRDLEESRHATKTQAEAAAKALRAPHKHKPSWQRPIFSVKPAPSQPKNGWRAEA